MTYKKKMKINPSRRRTEITDVEIFKKEKTNITENWFVDKIYQPVSEMEQGISHNSADKGKEGNTHTALHT